MTHKERLNDLKERLEVVKKDGLISEKMYDTANLILQQMNSFMDLSIPQAACKERDSLVTENLDRVENLIKSTETKSS